VFVYGKKFLATKRKGSTPFIINISDLFFLTLNASVLRMLFPGFAAAFLDVD